MAQAMGRPSSCSDWEGRVAGSRPCGPTQACVEGVILSGPAGRTWATERRAGDGRVPGVHTSEPVSTLQIDKWVRKGGGHLPRSEALSACPDTLTPLLGLQVHKEPYLPTSMPT